MVSSVERLKCIWPSASLISSNSSTAAAAILALVLATAGTACGTGQTTGTGDKPSAIAVAPADLVLVNGTMLTMDPLMPQATGMAIRNGRIVAVGNDKQMKQYVGPKTRRIDLKERGVTPGLVDAHAHLVGLGAAREQIDLRGTKTEQGVAAKVAKAAATRKKGEWITGRGWDQTLWSPAKFPHHRTLDKLVADHPVAIRRVDGHATWANKRAMDLAGITDKTPDPKGGRILRDADNKPTGVFIDTAASLISKHIPAAAPALIRRRILAAAKYAVSLGLTGVHEMGIGSTTAGIYAELAKQNKLPLRVYAFLGANAAAITKLSSRKPIADTGNSFFSARGIKLYADGALGSRGASLLAPYSDEPGKKGLQISTATALNEAAMFAAKNGWQLGTHAIGDASIRAVLDAYEKAIAAHPKSDLRFRVEHAQVVSLRDIPRFAKLGVLASMQPTHATSDMRWAEARVGPERIKGAYAWRKLLNTGARVVAGSDFPVERASPLLGLHAAVTRQDSKGKPAGGWYPKERMTLHEAVAAFTVEPAYASFVENHRGRLRKGYVADITVFDKPLASGKLLQTRVDMTIVEGRIVFARTVK